MALRIVPVSIKDANEYVSRHHRHHQPKTNGYRYALGVAEDDLLVGVAIVGNPVGRALCDGLTLEVNRTCTDGTRNANSMLYGAAWKAARALGFHRLITYILPEEGGASLKACGWICIGEAGGGSWDRPNCGRPRTDKHPTGVKLRWEIATTEYASLKDSPRPAVKAPDTEPQQRSLLEAA